MQSSYDAALNGTDLVEQLLSDITSSAHAALREYRASGSELPLPSTTTPHPLDSVYDNIALKKALHSLYHACNKLSTTLATPAHAVGESMMLATEPACLRVAVEAQVAEVLVNAHNGLPMKEISKQIPHIDSGKLYRTLRFLVSRGYFREVSPEVFANNRLSLGLLPSNSLSAAVGYWTNDITKGHSVLLETFTDPDSAFTHDPSKSPLVRALKGDGPETDLFTLYASQPHTGGGKRLAHAMMGWTKITGSVTALQYPLWKELPCDSIVCDVGSGIGAFAMRLTKAYPHLKVTLSDLPEIMEQAREHWSTEFPEAVESERTSFVPIDFLREAPKGADIYYLRHIMHDWADTEVKKILSAVRNAMKPQSKLLIHEFIIPDKDGLGEDFLPASSRIYNLDVTMLSMFNGTERTRSHYAHLCANVGLKLVNSFNMVETSILEFHISNT